MHQKKVYEIDGAEFSTLEEFAEVFSRVVLVDYDWKGNLDAFNDVLRGGFGTPDEGFVLLWKNSEISCERLGYSETVRRLEQRLDRCHPVNRPRIAQELEQARKHCGSTIFECLVEIIQCHAQGGEEEEDGVELRLE